MSRMYICTAIIRCSTLLCLLAVSTYLHASRSYHQPIDVGGLQLDHLKGDFNVEYLSTGALKPGSHVLLELESQGSTQQTIHIRPMTGRAAAAPIYAVLKILKSQNKVKVNNQVGTTRHGDPVLRVNSSWAADEVFSFDVLFESKVKHSYFTSKKRQPDRGYATLYDRRSCQVATDQQKVSYKIYFYQFDPLSFDQDADGVPDSGDQCFNTALDTAVDKDGCAIVEVDAEEGDPSDAGEDADEVADVDGELDSIEEGLGDVSQSSDETEELVITGGYGGSNQGDVEDSSNPVISTEQTGGDMYTGGEGSDDSVADVDDYFDDNDIEDDVPNLECGDEDHYPFMFTINTEGTYEIYTKQVLDSTPHYDVDCDSDGVLEGEGVTGNYVCTYPGPGHYTVALYGDVVSFSTSPGIFSPSPSAHEMVSVEQWGDIPWQSMLGMFSRASNMQINAPDMPDMSRVEDMRFMFYRATNFNSDISSWDLSAVRLLEGVFYHASSFNRDLNQWDVSGVTSMKQLFRNASSFNSGIGSWDVSAVTNMQSMFESAIAFNSDVSAWDMVKVSNMKNMFYKAAVFNSYISAWDVSSVVNMSGMFQDAIAFNGGVDVWNVSSVREMDNMFNGAWSFDRDLSAWDVSNANNMAGMFNGAILFNGDIGAWDIAKVTDLRLMFAEAHSFNRDIASWDVSNVTRMDAMFAGASRFNADISDWSVSKVSNMDSMFKRAGSFNRDISAWDISGVSDMTNMFKSSGLAGHYYDALLSAWGALPNVQHNVVLGADNISYSIAGQLGRNTLAHDYGWIINDSGLQ